MSGNASGTLPAAPANSRRSLFQRLTKPLRARHRTIVDFHIKADEPHRQYSQGDTVKGAVVLTVLKPVRLTHITVALYGFVRVYKHANAGSESSQNDAALMPSTSSRKSQYFGNGHASLFQDEVTLCGEGRLDVGVYEFNFELDFPRKGLPTSIDFERGTISYMLRATLTRPTSISPTSFCDRKVTLVEKIDIGPMRPPKARTISLEPISKRSRMKRTGSKSKVSSSQASMIAPGSSVSRPTAEVPLPEDAASQHESTPRDDNSNSTPTSPLHSDAYTVVSAQSVPSSDGCGRNSVPSISFPGSSHPNSSKASVVDKTITAEIEIFKSGYLPGDNIQVKISVKHTKRIKSMHGIIVTLYRQSRIDSAPPLSLFKNAKGKEAEKLKHEEYYPKSKTGLAGLSLTSAGSSSVFRKDLAQTFAPLIIDPSTLSAHVTTSIQVPADAFPTIQDVPGQMISFKYHVEVVLDLGGKLAVQEKAMTGAVNTPKYGSSAPQAGGMFSALHGNIVDTDHIRRGKSVVACVFEIVVGTTDSARKRGRSVTETIMQQDKAWAGEAHPSVDNQQSHSGGGEMHEQYHDPHYQDIGQEDHAYYHHDQPYHEDHQYYNPEVEYQHSYPNDHPSNYQYFNIHGADPSQQYNYPHDYQPDYHNDPHYRHQTAPIYVPPPDLPPETTLTDKERVRLAEQRLLPSQPPGGHDEEGGPSSSRTIVPSAPSDPDAEEDLYSANDRTPRPPNPSSPSHHGFDEALDASAPPVGALHSMSLQAAPGAAQGVTEDKQELERRRLMAEASSPFANLPDEDAGESSHTHEHMEASAPSAPVLDDDDDEVPGIPGPSSGGHSENLPAYRR